MLNKLNSSTNIKGLLLIVALAIPCIVNADENIFENNIDVLATQTNLESSRYESKIANSLFLPEFSLNTGIGSEYTIDKTETEKGPYLYLDGKINLFRGNRDKYQTQRIQTSNHKFKFESELILRKTKVEVHGLISNISALQIDTSYIENEIKENENQLKMAKKKVDAGLTTSADLLDFQIKNENLQNELMSNEFKIFDLNKKLNTFLGNKISLEQVKNEISTKELSILPPANSMALPEIQILMRELENSKLEIKNVNAEYLPTLDLEGKYGSITPHKKLFENKTEHQVALNLNIPLFSGFSTGNKKSQAILESTQKERELRQLEAELEKNIELEKKKIELNQNIISSLEKSLEKASRYKELTITEYKKGIKNSSDVINASDKKFELTRKINEIKQENINLIYAYNTTFKTN